MKQICTAKRAIETVYRIYGKETIEKQFGKDVCPSPGSITDHIDRWKRVTKELYLDKKDLKRCKRWLRAKDSPLNYDCFCVHIKDSQTLFLFRLAFDTREVYYK